MCEKECYSAYRKDYARRREAYFALQKAMDHGLNHYVSSTGWEPTGLYNLSVARRVGLLNWVVSYSANGVENKRPSILNRHSLWCRGAWAFVIVEEDEEGLGPKVGAIEREEDNEGLGPKVGAKSSNWGLGNAAR